MAEGLLYAKEVQYSVNTANLNQAANTVLASFFVSRPATVRRYGVIAEAAEGRAAVVGR